MNGNKKMTNRQIKILDFLKRSGVMGAEELAREFSVTATTIRRDLVVLEGMGLLERSRGKASLSKGGLNLSVYDVRFRQREKEKKMIAKAACRYIKPYDTIILDSGTTTLQMAKRLCEEKIDNVAIITNSYPAISELCENYMTMVMGGTFDYETMSMIGPQTQKSLEFVMADTAFLGATGVNPGIGFSIQSQLHLGVKQAILESAVRKIALIDSGKFKILGGNIFCKIDDVDVLITVLNEENEEQLEKLRKTSDIEIVYANEQETNMKETK